MAAMLNLPCLSQPLEVVETCIWALDPVYTILYYKKFCYSVFPRKWHVLISLTLQAIILEAKLEDGTWSDKYSSAAKVLSNVGC